MGEFRPRCVPFDRPEGFASLRRLIDHGCVSPDQQRFLAREIESERAFGDWVLGQLGDRVGRAYLLEEDAESRFVHWSSLVAGWKASSFRSLSTWMFLSTFDNREPWHRGWRSGTLTPEERWAEEAAEGGSNAEFAFHPSLRLAGIKPDARVLQWFDRRLDDKERSVGVKIKEWIHRQMAKGRHYAKDG